MANTKKGIKTQDTIIKTAKYLFYVNGFDDVSLSDICEWSNHRLGTLTYYFPKKWNIIDSLYQQYMNEIQLFVNDNTDGISLAEKYFYVITLYYYNIYSDDNITRFHYQIMSECSMNNIFYDTKTFITPLVGGVLEEELLDLYIKADNAVRRELNLSFMENTKKRTLKAVIELVRNIHLVAVRLYGFDKELLNSYLVKSEEFVSKHAGSIRLIEK